MVLGGFISVTGLLFTMSRTIWQLSGTGMRPCSFSSCRLCKPWVRAKPCRMITSLYTGLTVSEISCSSSGLMGWTDQFDHQIWCPSRTSGIHSAGVSTNTILLQLTWGNSSSLLSMNEMLSPNIIWWPLNSLWGGDVWNLWQSFSLLIPARYTGLICDFLKEGWVHWTNVSTG